MNGSHERLGVLHAKRVDLRTVSFPKTSTTQAPGWVCIERPVPISEVKGASENADGVVVGLLAPLMSVRECDELGVANFIKNQLAYLWAPNAVEYLSIRSHRRSRQIVSPKACVAVSEVFVEGVVAQPKFGCAFQAPQESVVGKLVREGKRSLVNLAFDHFEALRHATKVGL